MKVFLRDIPPEGLDVRQEVAAEEIGLTDRTFACLTPLGIDARFDKVDAELLAQVGVRSLFEMPCARCLEPVRQERHDQFELVFDITPETEFVEYGDEIRQEMVVRLSAIIHCRENCRGLCPSCGENLNTASCRCPKKEPKAHGIKIQLEPPPGDLPESRQRRDEGDKEKVRI